MLTVADVEKAQQAWGQGIVEIATAHNTGMDYVERAREHVASLYAYHMGPVLFKPTMAAVEQFRPTFESALSYFVASNGECPEDMGFAIKGWTKVRFENAGILLDGTSALAMGNYFFTDLNGAETKVEYTFGYIPGPNGEPLIHLHHSSMPASID